MSHRFPARERSRPQNFCSGPGQVSLSQETDTEAKAEPAAPVPVVRRGRKSPRKSPAKRSRSAPPLARDPVADDEVPDDASLPPDEEEEADYQFEEVQHAPPADARPATTRRAIPEDKPAVQYPEKLSTGVRSFNAWYHMRIDANPGTFTDIYQDAILASDYEHQAPIDLLCPAGHVARRDMLMQWLPFVTQLSGPNSGDLLAACALRQYLLNVFSYLKHWEAQADERVDKYGTWGLDHPVYRSVKEFLHKRQKNEGGLTTALVPLNVDAQDPDDQSMLSRMNHNSATTPEEHVELICMWYRGARARRRRRRLRLPYIIARARARYHQHVRVERLQEEHDGAVPRHAAYQRLLRLPLLLRYVLCCTTWSRRAWAASSAASPDD